MKVSVFGAGYVGLVQASVLAEAGFDTVCLDIDEDKVAGLKRSEISIYEPGLESLVRENQAAGRLKFTTDDKRPWIMARSSLSQWVLPRRRWLGGSAIRAGRCRGDRAFDGWRRRSWS